MLSTEVIRRSFDERISYFSNSADAKIDDTTNQFATCLPVIARNCLSTPRLLKIYTGTRQIHKVTQRGESRHGCGAVNNLTSRYRGSRVTRGVNFDIDAP